MVQEVYTQAEGAASYPENERYRGCPHQTLRDASGSCSTVGWCRLDNNYTVEVIPLIPWFGI